MGNNVIRASTIFITGLSASGKSTLGKQLRDDLVKNGIKSVMLLDGEEIRQQLAQKGKHYGYSREERNEVALKIARIAREYNREGIISIMCSICHLKDIRQKMRNIIGDVMEVYLDCPVNICAKRDYKGQYKKAFNGQLDNFVGVTETYELSDRPELTVDTANYPREESSQMLLDRVLTFINERVKREPKSKRVVPVLKEEV